MAKMKTGSLTPLALLIAIANIAMATDILTKRACDGETLRIDCGEEFIKVWSALYGRADPTVCEDENATALDHVCRADMSNFLTVRHCDGESSCEITAESALYGDPCSDVSRKYLQVDYYCSSHTPSECNARDSPTYKVKYACDNTKMVLECTSVGEVLKILEANYGRQGSELCDYRPGIDDVFCDDDSGETFEAVCLMCRGKKDCEIPVSSEDFKDRCLNTNKYLSVQYVCIATEIEEEEEEEVELPNPGHSYSETEEVKLPPRRGSGHSEPLSEDVGPERPSSGDSETQPEAAIPESPSTLPVGPVLVEPGNIGGSIGSSNKTGGVKTFKFGSDVKAPAQGNIGGSIGSSDKTGGVETFKVGNDESLGPVPVEPSNIGGSIGSSNKTGGVKTFKFGSDVKAPGPGYTEIEPEAEGPVRQERPMPVEPDLNTYQGFIDQKRPDGSDRTFSWGGQFVSGITSLFQPTSLSPRSTEMLMKIVVTTDSSGQKFFTLQPFGQDSTTVTTGDEFLMKVDTTRIQEYMQRFSFSRQIEKYNQGITFFNREDEMTVPFQMTVGNGQKTFFPSVFQMMTEINSQGQTVATPTNPSSNFQMVLDGVNQDVVDYLMTFADMTQELRAEFNEHNLMIPVKVYNKETGKIQEIQIPFYVNYDAKSTLSQLFASVSKPTSQFGMKFQITNENGKTELITLPFTVLEDQGKRMIFLTLPTCAAFKMYGFTADKEYLIDPDGINSGEQPYVVNCAMEEGTTVINHDQRESTVASYPADQDRLDVDITYEGATTAQLAALRKVSQACEQEIVHECLKPSAHFLEGKARIWWEGIEGVKMENWGGVATGASMCHCGSEQACHEKEKVCNCDGGEGTSDWGVFTDKDTLPVTKVVFEKPAAEQGQDQLKVGQFECRGDQSSSTLQFFLMLSQMLANPRKTCDEFKRSGYELDGIYLLDPDGNGGEKPFTVSCEMEKQPEGVTVVHHELSNQRTIVTDAEAPGSYSADINYMATARQIANLKSVSESCDQSLTYECQRSAFHTGDVLNHWWVSVQNETMPNWAGAPAGFEGCVCKMDSSCVDNLACNCDKDDAVLRKDSGVLTDKDTLPVSQLRFGDTGDKDEFGFYTLGPLRCRQTLDTLPTPIATSTSCAEIKRGDATAMSGNYYIQPSLVVERFLVYCNMSGPEGVTMVYPNTGQTILIDGFYELPGTWSRSLAYGPSEMQLRSLVTTSASCRQFISHGCHSSLHHDPDNGIDVYTWWEARTGEKMTSWGNVSQGCECYKDKSCLGSEDNKCNCDSQSQFLVHDEGYLTDKSKLPVSAIRSGDLSDDKGYEYGTGNVGPLMCFGGEAGQELTEQDGFQCETFTTVQGSPYHALSGQQDLSLFEFSVQTLGPVSLQLTLLASESANYELVIGVGSEVTFHRCDSDGSCYDTQTKSFSFSPLSASEAQTFLLALSGKDLTLTSRGETLSFSDSSSVPLKSKFVSYRTPEADGLWKFKSSCQEELKAKTICGRSDKIDCGDVKVQVVSAVYGRIDNDVCPEPNPQTCYADVTDNLRSRPLCVNDGKICHFLSSLTKYRADFEGKDCRPVKGYLHVVYKCSSRIEARTLDACHPDPCVNGGRCDTNPKLPGYVCTCLGNFQGQHCEIELAECSALGDPHYKDFSGRMFDFQGNCRYVLAQDCQTDPAFQVDVVNKSPLHNQEVSSTAEVYVMFDGMTIELKGKTVFEDFKRITDSTKTTVNYHVQDDSSEVILRVPSHQLTVIWNYKDNVKVKLPQNGLNVCGLCGQTDGDPQSETFVKRGDKTTMDPVEFGNSWQVDDTCTANTALGQTQQTNNQALVSGKRIIADRYCAVISATGEPFDKCPVTARTAVDVHSSCVYDYVHNSREGACTIIRDYKASCERENLDQVLFADDWMEKNTQCGPSCPAHLTHTSCVDRGDTSCALLLLGNPDWDSACVPGCVCPSELYDNGEACVPQDKCGCADNGIYYKEGSRVMDTACMSECECLNGLLTCGNPTSPLCPTYHDGGSKHMYTCLLTQDGIYECACSPGFEASQDGTACQAIAMATLVLPSERRRRRRDTSSEECRDELGMAAGHIADAQITASSSVDGSPAKQARPQLSGWTAETANTDQWIKVDIGIPTQVTGLITQGGERNAQGVDKKSWVSAFNVDVSLDDQIWTAVHDTRGHMQFMGNLDHNSPVTNTFQEMIRSRFVRVIPTSWHEEITIRLELLGCKQLCDAEIGSFPATHHVSSDNWFVVNAGEPMNCAGHVTSWKVLRARPEPLVAWVLRPVKADPSGFLLVGRSYIPSGPADEETQYDLKEQRIPVQSGDVVGFLYERNPLYSSEAGEETTTFMWVHLHDIPDFQGMRVGSTVRFTSGQGPRAFSAVAVLEPSMGAPISSVQCSKELGLNRNNVLVPDEAFTASSHVKGHKPARARLNTLYIQQDKGSGWTPSAKDADRYLQVDLGSQHLVTGVVTQGRHEMGQPAIDVQGSWVTSYYVQYSQDCEQWKYVLNTNGINQRFSGNIDPHSASTNNLERAITARCLRIRPKDFYHRIGLRLELLGCSSDPCLSDPCEQGGTCQQVAGLSEAGYVCKCPEGWTGTVCQTPEGVCRSASSTYYRTFDGYHYYFPGECTYTLAKDCSDGEQPAFDILTNNAETGREIYVYTNNMRIELKQAGLVHVDGEACRLPMKRDGVSIMHNAYMGVLLETPYGLSLEWDGHRRVIVNLPTTYAGKTCGLCGNFDGDLLNEVPQDVSIMDYAQSFSVNDENCGECEKCALDLPCILDPSRVTEAANLCKPIIDPTGPFASCHSTIDPSTVYEDCRQDVCASDANSRAQRCTHLSEYADLCATSGIVIASWRKKDLCGITCPAGMIHTPCGSACPATCGSPHAPHSCTKPCQETCQCPDGYLKEGDKLCLLPSQCGCSDNGCYYQGGASFYRLGCAEKGACGSYGEVTYSQAQCDANAECVSRHGVYGCFCKSNYSGDGITCNEITGDKALLVCDDDVVDLRCDAGTYLDIVEVMYGRGENYEKCPTDRQPMGECSAEAAMNVAMTTCQGKESCHLRVSSEVFGDPCYGVKKYLEIDYECTAKAPPLSIFEETMKLVCQGDVMEIDCGDAYIEIVDAMYGRLTDGQVCPHSRIETVDCTAVNSLAVVQKLCHGQQKCTELHASNYMFRSNPCLNTFKYLQVKYKCSSTAVAQSDLPVNPCSNNPCLNGGSCIIVDNVQGYQCSCPHTWTGDNCQDGEVTCRASGISHIRDFNGQNFVFQGDSKYDLASSCHDNEHDFRVMIKKLRSPIRNEVSAVEAVHVHYDNKVVELKQEYRVILDGKKASDTMTLNFGTIRLCRTGNYLVLKTDFGMTVAWDGLHHVQVRLPDHLARLTCGLCGTYQGLTNEGWSFINRDGNKVDDVTEFGASWRVDTSEAAFGDSALITNHACTLWPSMTYQAQSACSELKNDKGLFHQCYSKVSADSFYEDCIYDMCATLPNQEFLCQAMAKYADACLDAGVVLGDWRAALQGGQCKLACPAGQVYSPCVQSCPKSCGDPHADRVLMDRCYEGCVCENSAALQDNDQCLSMSTGGCKRLGIYYQPEESLVNEQCSGQFVCQPGGEWVKNPMTCDPNAYCGIVEQRQDCICNANYAGNGKRCFHLSGPVAVSHKVVSQGEELRIDCGDLFVDIVSADYNYVDTSSPGAATDPDCQTDNAKDILTNHILRTGNILQITVSAYSFGDTCSVKDNVLSVKYICSPEPVLRKGEPGKLIHMRACDRRRIGLMCRKGSRIAIQKASYGRHTGGRVCNIPGKEVLTTSCRTPDQHVVDKLKVRCEHQEECTFHVPDGFLPSSEDPCPGTTKYLDVFFKCQPYEPH